MEIEDLTRCVEASHVSMLRLALSITSCSADAEDAVSSADVTAFEKRGELRDPQKAAQWLLRITSRKCYDLLRKRARIHLTAEMPDLPVFQSDLTGTVFAAIRMLPASYAQVLTLFYYDGYKAAQIAPILGLSRTTVFVRLNRGRKLLQARLIEEGVSL